MSKLLLGSLALVIAAVGLCVGCGPDKPSIEDAESAVVKYCELNPGVCTTPEHPELEMEITTIGDSVTRKLLGREITFWPVSATIRTPTGEYVKVLRVDIHKDESGEWVAY